MTDKATVEIPSAFQGKVAELHAKEGQVVHVGQLMLSFEGSRGSRRFLQRAPLNGAGLPHRLRPKPQRSARSGNGHGQWLPPSAALLTPIRPRRALAAPSTRRSAREMGVDLGLRFGHRVLTAA